jgi:predicted Ser/Thr protein kinase
MRSVGVEVNDVNTKRICPDCHQPLSADAPDGLCPECLMKAGLGTDATPGPERTAERAQAQFVAAPVEEVARLFPQLDILGFVGQGGMGAVYKARQKALDRVVALKILPPGAGQDPAFSDRFAREAKALARMNHPGIVTIYEFGQADGVFFFLMEFVEGANLRQLLQAGHLSPEHALAIVPKICDALQFAHDEGVMHRDIKPENILIDRKGRLKIADFGLAKLLGREPAGQAITRTGLGMGTPKYMAPEQIENAKAVDHRADIYSLGVVFYEMLTGELPLGRFAPPSQRVQVDVRLDEVVLKSLEKDPALRYQHASEVKSDVESIAGPDSLPTWKTTSVPTPTASAGFGTDLKLEREFELKATVAEVAARLKRWARIAGFACLFDSPQRWTFLRGSQLAALYTFRIRKIPTTLEVSIRAASPLRLHCVWHTRSSLTLPTRRDADRLAKELDTLVADLQDPRQGDGETDPARQASEPESRCKRKP